MTEKPKRLSPRPEAFRELFLKSGNLCAFPDCTSLLIDQDGTFIGQLCHIEAAEPGGARFNATMTNDERRAVSNLMLMCYAHHQVTNDVHKYTVARLRDIKLAHERRFSAADRELRERIQKLKWTTLIGAGIVAGVAIDDIAHHMTDTLGYAAGSDDLRRKRLHSDLEQSLRYAPRGAVFWHSPADPDRDVAKQLLEVFQAAGWSIAELSEVPKFGPASVLSDRAGTMIFVIGDKNQVSNARQAIFDFFEVCGFTAVDPNKDDLSSKGDRRVQFQIMVVIGKRQE